MELKVYPDPLALAQAAAGKFASLAQAAINNDGTFRVALAGGSTPLLLYQRLAQPPYLDGLDWEKMQVFWSDERCVPQDHPESNYRLAYQSLLKQVLLPEDNIHRVPGELPPEQAAAMYEAELRGTFGEKLPVFDLILLGLGEDGHTASLFPGSPALQEQMCWAVAVEHSSPPTPLLPRVTLTLPVINAARNVLFLVSGAAKAAILARLQSYIPGPAESLDQFPAQCIRPAGSLLFLVDQPAAAHLR